MKNYVTKEKSITNNSEFYILVGNTSDVISHHETLDEAVKTLNSINISDSKWGSIWILEPSETRSIKFPEEIKEPNHEEQEGDLFDFSKYGL
jgi:hypothetical protein